MGLAFGLAAYTPVRKLLTTNDLATDFAARDHADEYGSKDKFLAKALEYDHGVLGSAAKVRNYSHILPDPKLLVPAPHHATPDAKWHKPTAVPDLEEWYNSFSNP
eukprot:jgi/Chrzof1/1302/Cz10g02090.t1